MISNNEMFKIGYNFLTIVLLVEGVILLIEVFTNGYSQKAFFYLGFMFLSKISQINSILYFNRLENWIKMNKEVN